MKRHPATAAALLAATLLPAACSHDDVVEPAPAPATTTRAWTTDGIGAKLTEDQMRLGLLTQEDVEKNGWSPQTVDDDPEDDNTTDTSWYLDFKPDSCATWWADYAKGEAPATQIGSAGISFATSPEDTDDDHVEISDAVGSYETPQDAQDRLRSRMKALDVCQTFAMKTDKDDIVGTFTPVDGLRLGDDSVAWHMEFTDNTSKDKRKYQIDLAIVQVGHNLVSVQVWHHGKVSAQQLRSLTDAAFHRLDDATA